MSEELLPCPLCGNKAHVTHLWNSKIFNISCGIDETRTAGLFYSAALASPRKIWLNNGTPEPSPPKGIN